MKRKLDVKKLTVLSVVGNAAQIIAVLALVCAVFMSASRDMSPDAEKFVVLVGAVIVGFGAITDIRAAFLNMSYAGQREALEETYYQLEDLNRTMRAQRHDFMNHLQVVYSLIEMEEPKEACDYMDRVYGDMQRVNRVLRTDNAAINALLQAKLTDCEKRGIKLTLNITSRYQSLAIPSWEMCRVLGNLIDNAMEAVAGQYEKEITVELFEDLKTHRFLVQNNGPDIDSAQIERIFTPGVTTKRTGQGMGLYIVAGIAERYGGEIGVESSGGKTSFFGYVAKKATPEIMQIHGGEAMSDK